VGREIGSPVAVALGLEINWGVWVGTALLAWAVRVMATCVKMSAEVSPAVFVGLLQALTSSVNNNIVQIETVFFILYLFRIGSWGVVMMIPLICGKSVHSYALTANKGN
jgi:hypothetical protein